MIQALAGILSAPSNFIVANEAVELSGFKGACCRCRFETTQYTDALFCHYQDAVPAALLNATKVRKAEFLAGRIAARHAFIQLGITPQAIPIARHRQPLWPATVLASISHHADSAFCMMMPTPSPKPIISIGIDVESIVHAEDRALLSPSIASRKELDIMTANFLDNEYGFTVVFSAKEALFKALYPAVGRYFDFLDVEISAINISKCELEMRLLIDLSAQLLRGHTVTVRWKKEANTVISWVLPY